MIKLNYWQRRFLQIKLDVDKTDKSYIAEMKKRYATLEKKIEKEISHWVRRYSNAEGIKENEVRILLSKLEQRNWSMSLAEYKEKALAGGYKKELDLEHFKSRINRLEQLQGQLAIEFAEYANVEEKLLAQHLKHQLQESFLRNIYELSDRGSFAIAFDKYNSRALEVAISKPWKGSNFSKRVWGNLTKKLPTELSNTLSLATVNGWGVDKTVNEMMKNVQGIARNRMITLVQTESAHIAEVANEESMKQTGVKKSEWLATLEIHTCERCGALDGQIFDIEDEGAPGCPDHPNCRCTKIPVIEGFKDLHRWQRDPITGKGSIVENQTFEEWKEKKVKEQEQELSSRNFGANLDYIRSQKFVEKLKSDSRIFNIADSVASVAKRMVQHRNGTPFEDYYLLEAKTGKIMAVSNETNKRKSVNYNNQVKEAFKKGTAGQYVSVHNHPSSYPPSLSDIATLSLKSKNKSVGLGITVGHDGSVYWYTPANKKFSRNANNEYGLLIDKNMKLGYNEIKSQELALEEFSKLFGFNFGKVGE